MKIEILLIIHDSEEEKQVHLHVLLPMLSTSTGSPRAGFSLPQHIMTLSANPRYSASVMRAKFPDHNSLNIPAVHSYRAPDYITSTARWR